MDLPKMARELTAKNADGLRIWCGCTYEPGRIIWVKLADRSWQGMCIHEGSESPRAWWGVTSIEGKRSYRDGRYVRGPETYRLTGSSSPRPSGHLRTMQTLVASDDGELQKVRSVEVGCTMHHSLNTDTYTSSDEKLKTIEVALEKLLEAGWIVKAIKNALPKSTFRSAARLVMLCPKCITELTAMQESYTAAGGKGQLFDFFPVTEEVANGSTTEVSGS